MTDKWEVSLPKTKDKLYFILIKAKDNCYVDLRNMHPVKEIHPLAGDEWDFVCKVITKQNTKALFDILYRIETVSNIKILEGKDETGID